MNKIPLIAGVFHPAARAEQESFRAGLTVMKSLFAEVIESGLNRHPYRFYAGTPEETRMEWEFFLNHTRVDLLIAARGGAGSYQFINQISHKESNNNIPVIVGFSDITALMWHLFTRHHQPSIYGPVAAWHFARLNEWKTAGQFTELLTGAQTIRLDTLQTLFQPEDIHSSISGILIPACLSVLAEVVLPDELDESILLVLEDTNEKAYKIERYFQLLEYKGLLSSVAGLFLGDFSGTDRPEWIREAASELGMKHHFPVYAGVPFGHHLESLNLPFGVPASFNPVDRKLFWEPFLMP